MTTRRNFVGHKVRRLRKERGMTQSELASRIEIIQSDLCRMEKGEYRVGLDTLFKVLQVFDMNIGEFFDESAKPGGTATEAELVAQFRRLSAESRAEVLDYVRFKHQQETGTASSPQATSKVEGD